MKWAKHLIRALGGFVVSAFIAGAFAFAWVIGEAHR